MESSFLAFRTRSMNPLMLYPFLDGSFMEAPPKNCKSGIMYEQSLIFYRLFSELG